MLSPRSNQILTCNLTQRTLFPSAWLIYESPFSSLSLIYAPPPRDLAFVARPGARNNRAQTVWNNVWHTRPIHRTRVCIYSGPSFHEDFSWRWILTAKASQLERITRLFGILSGEPCRRCYYYYYCCVFFSSWR